MHRFPALFFFLLPVRALRDLFLLLSPLKTLLPSSLSINCLRQAARPLWDGILFPFSVVLFAG